MSNIFDTAKYVLNKSGPMTVMKLQKLCYYAQAWSLAWYNEGLFSEDFQAGANGPAFPELQNLHKENFTITSDDIPDDYCSCNLSKDQITIINEVLEYYVPHDGQWLTTLTQMEQPWKEARLGIAPGNPCTNIITKESMAVYYREL